MNFLLTSSINEAIIIIIIRLRSQFLGKQYLTDFQQFSSECFLCQKS